MTFKEWVDTVPRVIRDDPVWRVEAYRLALFAGDLAWHDSTKLLDLTCWTTHQCPTRINLTHHASRTTDPILTHHALAS